MVTEFHNVGATGSLVLMVEVHRAEQFCLKSEVQRHGLDCWEKQ
jgi:hypothetical protein